MILTVEECGPDYVLTTVQNDCRLGEKKNVNVPGVKIDLPVVDEREIHDIVNWAVPNSVHYIALSFVQEAADIVECRRHCGDGIKIIAKIENIEGIANFDEILREADGIMVARGDLGMEVPIEKLWLAQKWMIQKTRSAGDVCDGGGHVEAATEERLKLPESRKLLKSCWQRIPESCLHWSRRAPKLPKRCRTLVHMLPNSCSGSGNSALLPKSLADLNQCFANGRHLSKI